MSYESAFVSRAKAKAIARLYQAEGNDSFIYKAGDRKDPKTGVSKPWFKVELGKPGTLDAQLPQIEWYPSPGTRPARVEELPTPLRRGPTGEYLPVERVELERGEKAGPKYGASYPADEEASRALRDTMTPETTSALLRLTDWIIEAERNVCGYRVFVHTDALDQVPAEKRDVCKILGEVDWVLVQLHDDVPREGRRLFEEGPIADAVRKD